MRISTLINQPILLLGAGREGLATLACLQKRGHQGEIMVLGDRPTEDLPFGARNINPALLSETLKENTVVIRSPGFSPHHPFRKIIQAWGGQQTTATKLMLAELNAAQIPVIGVTASKGKSTTSSLLVNMLRESGQKAKLVGNIGLPALSQLDEILQERPIVIIEISSYQCDDLEANEGPMRVVLGRLFPEHLDWHGDLQHYYAAKANLLRSMPDGGQAFVDYCALETLEQYGLIDAVYRETIELNIINTPNGLHFKSGIFLDGVTTLCSDQGMQIPGQHNRDNACLAYAAARSLGTQTTSFQATLRQFSGLPFRLQYEGRHVGVDWINDSISTAPEAACAALEAFGLGGTTTLIVGGQDRGYDYRPLVAAINRFLVPHVILIPESGETIRKLAQSILFESAQKFSSTQFHPAESLSAAVQLAAKLTPPGGRCIFSPAAPSYHLWSDFESRGKDYRRCIELLTELKLS
jgi:UDP-N-acetylmuramoyl-L-alanine---L-glutamate ligase